jgi:hypothetical protein
MCPLLAFIVSILSIHTGKGHLPAIKDRVRSRRRLGEAFVVSGERPRRRLQSSPYDPCLRGTRVIDTRFVNPKYLPDSSRAFALIRWLLPL